MGSAPRLVIFGKGKNLEDRAATCLGGGKSGPLGHQEGVGGNAQRGMMVKASPASAFEMAEADLLLQFEIIALDAPAKFRRANEMRESDGCMQGREPEFRWLLLVGRPFDQEPFLIYLFGRD